MRILSITLLASACLIAIGCKHDLSKIKRWEEGGVSGEGADAGPDGENDAGGSSGSGGSGGESGSGGGSDERCTFGDERPCVCPDDQEGVQRCQLNRTYGPCLCEPVAGGTGGGGVAGIGGRGGIGGIGGTPGVSGIGGIGGVGGVGGAAGVAGIAPEPIICRPDCVGDDTLSLCMQYCNVFCENLERYCDVSRCPARDIFCSPEGTVVQTCVASCSDNDVDCARSVCETEKMWTCVEFAEFCLYGDATCDPGGTCRDTCVSHDDYECDDGGELSLYYACAWGTDCFDCGTRYGEPPSCSAVGCECMDLVDCCGFFFGLSTCVDPGNGNPTCYATCSYSGSDECDPGNECIAIDTGDTFVCVPLL